MNLTNISFGGSPGVSNIFLKVDQGLDGGFTLFILLIVFLLIATAFGKKYGSIEKGLVPAGFVCGILGAFLTVVGWLSWRYIWMCVIFFIIGFIAKNME